MRISRKKLESSSYGDLILPSSSKSKKVLTNENDLKRLCTKINSFQIEKDKFIFWTSY